MNALNYNVFRKFVQEIQNVLHLRKWITISKSYKTVSGEYKWYVILIRENPWVSSGGSYDHPPEERNTETYHDVYPYSTGLFLFYSK